jgi:glycosyltransferase involved in cell wall biosynthesis
VNLGLAMPGVGFQGGLERHGADLARALISRGHRVRLLHGAQRGRDAEDFRAAFSSAMPVDSPGATDGLELIWIEKSSSLEELQPFRNLPLLLAVHDHDLTCVRTSRMLAIGRTPCLRPPGIACAAHGCIVVRQRAPGRLPLALRNPFSLRDRLHALSLRAPLIACSQFLASTLVAAGASPSRVSHLHPIPPEDRSPLRPRPDAPRLLVAGQLVHGKGIDLAIAALHHLPQHVTLDIAGEGPSRTALEQLASAPGLRGRVHFHGYVAPERMPALYDDASVVLVPSRWPEPFGLIGIEAMRRARPVAAAAHGGITEWLPQGAGGEGFVPGDARDLARAALLLLRDPAAGKRARAEMLRRLSHGKSIDLIEEALHRARAGET